MDAGIQDRCRGVFLGLAAGDRNGGPIQMAVRPAESLVEREAFDPADVARRYLQWYREGAFDTGPVSGRALQLMASGMSAPEAAAQVHREFNGQTAGCNPAHRAAPLSMLASLADDDLPRCAAAEAALTHQHSLAGDVAGLVVMLCRLLIRGVFWGIAVEKAAVGRLPETQGALQAAKSGPGSTGGFSPEALRATVFFVATSSSFSEALNRSLAFAGPANYCPVLVGAVAGGRWGSAAIPTDALSHVGIVGRVQDAANVLASNWGACLP
jgi:ADP-ribosylglycohydrolase